MPFKLFLLLTSLTLISGCGGTGGSSDIMSTIKSALKLEPTKVWLETVYFEVDQKLNNDAPVTVDLVIIYDDKILDTLKGLTATQFFEQKEQIIRDNAKNIDIHTFDIIPGQTLPPQPIKPKKVTGKGILVFALYGTPGDHRQLVGADRAITIQMNAKDFKIVPFKNPDNAV